jgi:hypothetical protein
MPEPISLLLTLGLAKLLAGKGAVAAGAKATAASASSLAASGGVGTGTAVLLGTCATGAAVGAIGVCGCRLCR